MLDTHLLIRYAARMPSETLNLGRSVLYFPSIEFRDEQWLRSALCVWETVYRIVPPDYQPRDSTDIQALARAGLVKNLAVSKGDMERAEQSFGELIRTGCRPAALTGDASEIRRLHKGKVGERLHDFFQADVSPLETEGTDWFEGPASLIHAYMIHLAEAMARARGIAKVTDDKDTFSVAPFVDSGGQLDSDCFCPHSPMCYAALNLELLLPKSAGNLPVGDLIEFRKRSSDGRSAMAGLIAELAGRLSSIHDEAVAKDVLNELSAKLSESLVQLRRQQTVTGMELACACLSVGIQAAIGVFSLSNPLTPTTVAAGVTLAAIASIAQAAAARRLVTVDPVRSYYVELDQTAQGVCKSRTIHRENDFYAVMEEYIND
jgi:hypothetical protein